MQKVIYSDQKVVYPNHFANIQQCSKAAIVLQKKLTFPLKKTLGKSTIQLPKYFFNRLRDMWI
jgi:hypothetical protein